MVIAVTVEESGFSGFFFAKKPTRTEPNRFGLNRFLVRFGLY
jgi:hypothetical protein